jgi:DNA-binding SARP family transcriptional activator
MAKTDAKPTLESLKQLLFRSISDLGWAPQEQLEDLARQELGADPLAVHQALRFLVRQDYVTLVQGPDGRKGLTTADWSIES